MTSTIYTSLASSKVIKACFVCSQGHLSRNSSAKILELTTSWCSISRTVRTNSLLDHGGFPFWEELNWSRSSLRIPAVYYTVSWPSFSLIWIHSHPIACCFLVLLLRVLQTIFKCASWVIFLVAALAVLRWTNCCLRSCCVPESDILGATPVDPPGSVLFSPGWGVCVAMICLCRIGEEDDNKKKWKVLRNIYFTTSQNEISNCQVARFTQVKSCCVWLHIAGVSNHSAFCNQSVWCCLCVYKNQ